MVTIASWVRSSFKFQHISLKIDIWKRHVFPEFPTQSGIFVWSFPWRDRFTLPMPLHKGGPSNFFPTTKLEEPWCLRPSPPTVARLVGIEGGSARSPASAHPSYVSLPTSINQNSSPNGGLPTKKRPNLANSRHPETFELTDQWIDFACSLQKFMISMINLILNLWITARTMNIPNISLA